MYSHAIESDRVGWVRTESQQRKKNNYPNGMPDRSSKRGHSSTSCRGDQEAAATAREVPLALAEEQIIDVPDAATSDDDDASCASEPPARKWRAPGVCRYLHSRECRSDAATTVIIMVLVVLVVEHYVELRRSA